MMGGKKMHSNYSNLNYARNDQERDGVFENLIGSFTKEEIDKFSAWIDRQHVGLIQDGLVPQDKADMDEEYE